MKLNDLRGKLPIHSSKKYAKRSLSDIRSIAIHHSLTTSGSATAFANYHVGTNDWPGIGYTYVIDRDGMVNWCWDWDVISYHVGDSNRRALGICLVGDFRTQQPAPEQYAAAIELVRMLQNKIPSATEVKGHSEYPGYNWKACPVISMDKFRRDLKGDEVMLDKGVANTIINTWIKPAWQDADRARDEKAKDYIHWLANELRIASGQEKE
ncbi:peptidoglycan recognition family protein [Paenibacillus sp. RC84]|uniref:peptidoglycan recognition protein family protein n=1 Tax=Paenibacillus sp. RC84 TaxID=3156252 RepID=UPI003510EE3B